MFCPITLNNDRETRVTTLLQANVGPGVIASRICLVIFFIILAACSQFLSCLSSPRIEEPMSVRSIYRNSISWPSRIKLDEAYTCSIIAGSIIMGGLSPPNTSFPNLIELTGYLAVHHVANLESLSRVFPKLRVIRGEELLLGHALLIYEMPHLQNIGLISLRRILRGSVYIGDNQQLCYLDTIDWSRITGPEVMNTLSKSHSGEIKKIFQQLVGSNKRGQATITSPGLKVKTIFKNLSRGDSVISLRNAHLGYINHTPVHYDSNLKQTFENVAKECLDLCPTRDLITGMACPVNIISSSVNKPLCWNDQSCQLTCPDECRERGDACYYDRIKRGIQCCNIECLGGCWGSGSSQCFSCMHLLYLAQCVSQCPEGSFLLGHVCYTEEQCTIKTLRGKWKAVNGRCSRGCPSNYKESSDGKCVLCLNEECQRECNNYSLVDSIQSASFLRGCNILLGNLRVHFNDDSGEKALQEYLSELRNVTGFVEISGSFGLTSLTFLKSLKFIEGRQLYDNEYALVIRDNKNINYLFDFPNEKNNGMKSNGNLKIYNGRVYLKRNPKLCSVDINQLIEYLNQTMNAPNVTEYQDPNSLHCTDLMKNLSVAVVEVTSSKVSLKWEDSFQAHTAWIVYFQALPTDECVVKRMYYSCESKWNTTFIMPSSSALAGHHNSGNSFLLDGNSNDTSAYDINSNDTSAYDINSNKNNKTTQRAQLDNLIENQNYAVFISKMFLMGEKKRGYRSELLCFKTDVARPSKARDFKVSSLASTTATLHWLPPKHKRGRIEVYIVKWRPSELDKDHFKPMDYCIKDIPLLSNMQTTFPKLLAPLPNQPANSAKFNKKKRNSKEELSSREGSTTTKTIKKNYLQEDANVENQTDKINRTSDGDRAQENGNNIYTTSLTGKVLHDKKLPSLDVDDSPKCCKCSENEGLDGEDINNNNFLEYFEWIDDQIDERIREENSHKKLQENNFECSSSIFPLLATRLSPILSTTRHSHCLEHLYPFTCLHMNFDFEVLDRVHSSTVPSSSSSSHTTISPLRTTVSKTEPSLTSLLSFRTFPSLGNPSPITHLSTQTSDPSYYFPTVCSNDSTVFPYSEWESSNTKVKFVKGDNLELQLKNLKHFQEYIIEVTTCNINRNKNLLCSSPTFLFIQTLPNATADSINHKSLKAWVASNNFTCNNKDNIETLSLHFNNPRSDQDSVKRNNLSQDISNAAAIHLGDNVNEGGFDNYGVKYKEVLFTWREPLDPNGVVLGYWVKIEGVGGDGNYQIFACITHEKFLSNGRIFRQLLMPGNYSWKVRALSLAGNSSWSEPSYITVYSECSGGQWSVTKIFIFVISTIICFLVLLMIVAVTLKLYRIRVMKKQEAYLKISLNPNYVEFGDWETPRERIKMGEVIGTGRFGMVYKGEFEKENAFTTVAIKIVKEVISFTDRLHFLQEVVIMKEFDSPHIIKLVGVASKERPYLVVMEMMDNGDLLSFLRKNRNKVQMGTTYYNSQYCSYSESQRSDDSNEYMALDSSHPSSPITDESQQIYCSSCIDENIAESPAQLTLVTLLGMAAEIADGLAYLISKKFVHRDLAARNCLVDSNLVVKVSDFGLTRTLDISGLYHVNGLSKSKNCAIPVRWMAPEVLKAPTFNDKTDVWSYGVVLWEIFTLGMKPYTSMSNSEVVKFVVGGGKLGNPSGCPQVVKNTMQACLKQQPTDRPTFLQIVENFIAFAKPNFSHSFYSNNSHSSTTIHIDGDD